MPFQILYIFWAELIEKKEILVLDFFANKFPSGVSDKKLVDLICYPCSNVYLLLELTTQYSEELGYEHL